ncbi:hypothetical protein DMUE_3955 [Dictyocoela muelleri]|nr:hypothetical protein DMUE_3955 [Dictyocoela muelleri]
MSTNYMKNKNILKKVIIIILLLYGFSSNLINNDVVFIENIINNHNNYPNIYIKGFPEIYGVLNKLTSIENSGYNKENDSEDIIKNVDNKIFNKSGETKKNKYC